MQKAERIIGVQPDQAGIRAALSRIVTSPGLNRSPQLAHFLTFVVNETLAGRGDRIKAYNIAADALGRDTDFDPQKDPIVRVEAGRLRLALNHYYSNGGGGDPIIIELPRGHYVPVFRLNKPRRRARARLRAHWRQITEPLRNNIRLVITIVVIAVAVCVARDMIWLLLGISN